MYRSRILQLHKKTMLFTSKNKSDVNLKGQRIQRFLRENINRAKTRQVKTGQFKTRACLRSAKFDTRVVHTCYPEACSLTCGKHRR